MCPPLVTYFYVVFFFIQLYKEIEICQKITQHIQIEKSDASSDIYGEFLSLICFYFSTKSVLVCAGSCLLFSNISDRPVEHDKKSTSDSCAVPQKARSPALKQDGFICSAPNTVFRGARAIGCAAR